jgi:hypothetical protein
MATTKKNNYIEMELEWLEAKAEEQRAFVDSMPLSLLKDRKDEGGEKSKVVATIEAIHKNIRETLKDYALIIEAIAKLREKEETKKQLIRGTEELTPMESGEV